MTDHLITLSDAQVAQLLKPINPSRVAVLDGLSHLEAYDVRAHLIRVFGFGGWSGDVLDMQCLYEQPTQTSKGKEAFKVAYRCTYRLTIRIKGQELCSFTEVAVGESLMPDFKRGDCHDMAAKTAESQALKRCAVNLGDQFGLSLYRKGSTVAVVKATLGHGGATEQPVDHEAPPVIPEHSDTLSAADSPPPGPVEPPLVAPGPGSPSDSLPEGEPTDVAEQTAAQVESLRTAAVALLTGTKKQDALQRLTRLQLNASKAKLMGETVMSVEGQEVTVSVFLNEILSAVSRGSS